MKAFIAGIYSYRMRCNTHFYCCAKYPDAVFIWNSCVDAVFAIWDGIRLNVTSLSSQQNHHKTRVFWLIRLSAVTWRLLIKQKRTVKIYVPLVGGWGVVGWLTDWLTIDKVTIYICVGWKSHASCTVQERRGPVTRTIIRMSVALMSE